MLFFAVPVLALLSVLSETCGMDAVSSLDGRVITLDVFDDEIMNRHALAPEDFTTLSDLFNEVLGPREPFNFQDLPDFQFCEVTVLELNSKTTQIYTIKQLPGYGQLLAALAHVCYIRGMRRRELLDLLRESRLSVPGFVPHLQNMALYNGVDGSIDVFVQDLQAMYTEGAQESILTIRSKWHASSMDDLAPCSTYMFKANGDSVENLLSKLALRSWSMLFTGKAEEVKVEVHVPPQDKGGKQGQGVKSGPEAIMSSVRDKLWRIKAQALKAVAYIGQLEAVKYLKHMKRMGPGAISFLVSGTFLLFYTFHSTLVSSPERTQLAQTTAKSTSTKSKLKVSKHGEKKASPASTSVLREEAPVVQIRVYDDQKSSANCLGWGIGAAGLSLFLL